jgi:hypothetical protein
VRAGIALEQAQQRAAATDVNVVAMGTDADDLQTPAAREVLEP